MATVTHVLTGAIKQAHWLINAIFEDVDDELANRPVEGKANPLGTAYAHVVIAEDGIVHGMLQGLPPLMATDFAGRTGVDLPMPAPGGPEGDLGEWFKTAKVDTAALRTYAAAVFEETERFISETDDTTLDKPIDLSFAGLGVKPLTEVFTLLVVEHCDNFSGELSAIKGTFGLKGYPF